MALETAYEVHPLADLIPAMRDDEFAELKEDIAANGLREAIKLYEGKILDGRHRYRACEELGVWPVFDAYTGDEPAAYVLSLNVKRRQLTPSQKAMMATDFLPYLREEARVRQGRRTDLQPTSGSTEPEVHEPIRATAEAAERVGVSTGSVKRAVRVKETDPELAEQVRNGDISVRAAELQVSGRSPEPPRSERSGSTNGGGQKPPGSRWTRTPGELVENVIGMVDGLPAAIQQIDVQSAVASPDAPLADWDKRLTKAITALVQLRKQIRGANS